MGRCYRESGSVFPKNKAAAIAAAEFTTKRRRSLIGVGLSTRRRVYESRIGETLRYRNPAAARAKAPDNGRAGPFDQPEDAARAAALALRCSQTPSPCALSSMSTDKRARMRSSES